MYKYQTRIKLHETDAAGRMFFAEQLKIAHDAWEEFLLQNDFPLRDLCTRYDFSLPIVHVEADYLGELCASDAIDVEISVQKIGTTSFILDYRILRNATEFVGTVRTVHVTIDIKSGKKIPLPNKIKSILKSLSSPRS
ncbi:MAG: acyl-CoA thioesterase [Calditrichaeota bacterium]|nr:MAG: acyl-CoA thioesterase [Calditrichota bacterium]